VEITVGSFSTEDDPLGAPSGKRPVAPPFGSGAGEGSMESVLEAVRFIG
jgi:hypothetical protein